MTAPDLQAVAARDGLTNSTEGYSSTFYPSATSRLAAVPVVVRGGIESLATDITMQKPKTYAVTGRILLRAAIPPRAPTTRGLVPTTTVRYFIFPRGDEVLETGQNHRPFPLAEEFQIPGLLPGSYDLVLRVGDFWGKATETGELEIPNVPPGRYKVLLQQPEVLGGYIADIREGSRSLNDGVIDANAATQSLEVVVRAGGGSVAGVVRGGWPDGRLVLLIPQPPRRQSWFLYKTASVAQDNTFTLSGIAPGQYKLFAWPLDGTGGNAHLNEQFLSKIESRGKIVTVSDNGKLDGVALDLIPRELR